MSSHTTFVKDFSTHVSLVIDEVTLGNGLVISNQSIGVATKATGFSDVDGILG